jgi:hypothetical protein
MKIKRRYYVVKSTAPNGLEIWPGQPSLGFSLRREAVAKAEVLNKTRGASELYIVRPFDPKIGEKAIPDEEYFKNYGR